MEPGQMTCALKVDTQSSGWHKTLTKVLKGIDGLAFTIDAPQGIARVSGKIDPTNLLLLLAKAGKHAEILWVDSGTHPTGNNVQGNVYRSTASTVGHNGTYGQYNDYPYSNPYQSNGYHTNDPAQRYPHSQYQLDYPHQCYPPQLPYYEQPALHFPQAPPPVQNQRLESFCNMM